MSNERELQAQINRLDLKVRRLSCCINEESSSSGLTIGTSTITSGTSGRVLYDNAGVLGEMTTTGSGTVLVLATSPTLVTPILGAATFSTLTDTLTGQTSNTVINAVSLINNTAATSGNQQYSPYVLYSGKGWKTGSGGASQDVSFRTYALPIQGASTATGKWTVEKSINGGAFSEVMSVSNSGVLSAISLTSTVGNITTGGAFAYASNNSSIINGSTTTQLWTLPDATGTVGIINTSAPSSATDTGVTGEIRITSTFIYTCIATNTWVRSVAVTW